MKTIISHSSQGTNLFGQKLAASLKGGEIFALIGDLGAGKTVLAKGLAKGLGVKSRVNSPTFNILKLYSVKNHQNIKYFCHVDAYRLNSAPDLEAIGVKDFLEDKQVVTLIEWAEKIKPLLPKGSKIIKIEHLTDNSRKINY
ncbi:MAG: tRNA (adenosine(37)-N6)-threonylcarbamoyltransferase complex ATPase subunit type 1 TsaE [Candidatus Falkowbacteria bacterium]|nr:tRNA (adenosine(37)-N6)-threonylcarbamoyltransferase complex ATPase subunit type 1 TsaE [Candidatus Falkowbacteria bacterium]